MSTRTDWGIFTPAGSAVAVGDEHHKWQCPQQEFRAQYGEDFYTGQQVYEGMVPVQCPWKTVSVKLDVCEKCKMQFIYP